MHHSTRVLTKLTLIPLHFIIKAFYSLTNEKELWKMNKDQHQLFHQKWSDAKNARAFPAISYNSNHAAVADEIKRKTKLCNKNNITRTAAYLSFFKEHPEIHWAFLAHMVSRNAGYFMTDLKGEYLSGLINQKLSDQLFGILEKGNSIIFQDAYPQLLLYEASKKQKQPLFHLSRHFHVSAFMEGAWNMFFEGDTSPLLPVAQIINEQSHIEHHLIKTEEFNKLYKSLPYRMQNWMELSQILFPVVPLKSTEGITMKNFSHLSSRIALGRDLYVILFQRNKHASILEFAQRTEHTGSRMDYDHNVFSTKATQFTKKKEKLSFFKTKKRTKLYSPKLLEVWYDFYSGPFFPADWFSVNDTDKDLFQLSVKPSPNIWLTYWAGLHKTETVFLLNHFIKNIKKRDA